MSDPTDPNVDIWATDDEPQQGASQGAQQSQPDSLAAFVAQSHEDAATAAQQALSDAEQARARTLAEGRKALQAQEADADHRAALAEAARGGATLPEALDAMTQELAGSAETAEDFYASLQAADPNAVQGGGPVKGSLREGSVYGAPGSVQDIEPE